MPHALRHPDYEYVRLSINGPQDNRTVVTLDQVQEHVTPDVKDVYTSMFRFRKEYQEYVAEKGSVAGAKFRCFCDCLWFDLDHADNIILAYDEAKILVASFVDAGVPLDQLQMYFSGNKGFHVGVDIEHVMDPVPDINFPSRCKRMALSLARELKLSTFDAAVYDTNRLWRLPLTLHDKSGEYKSVVDIPRMLQGKDTKK